MNFWVNEEARQVEAGNPVYAGHDWSRPLRSLTYKELESRLAAVLVLLGAEDPEMTFPEYQSAVRAAATGG